MEMTTKNTVIRDDMSNEKNPGCLGNLLGMISYPVMWGIINHYKDPY